MRFIVRGSYVISERLHQRALRIFDYWPGESLLQSMLNRGATSLNTSSSTALNIEHKTERIGAFVTLVYGYSVVALLYQNQATFGMNA